HGSAEMIAQDTAQDLFEVTGLEDAAERTSSSSRAYLMTKAPSHHHDLEEASADLHESLGRLDTMVEDPDSRNQLKAIRRHESELRLALDLLLEVRRNTDDFERVGRLYDEQVLPKRRALDAAIDALMTNHEKRFKSATEAYRSAAKRTMPAIGALLIACMVAILGVAFFFTRLLNREYEIERVARQAREEILALVSHDLRNPL